MDISVVIPLLNEAESLPELTEGIDKTMQDNGYSYEIIYIDDGSTDDSWQVIENLSKTFQQIKAIRFRRNYGKSAALNEGFKKSIGNVVITMDADLQDNPEEIPEMYKMIMEDKLHLVSGWKKKRYDPLSKTIPTKLFNWATSKMSGIKLHDFNCGLKAYNQEVIKSIEVYGEMHRYIPVIAKWEGFKNIGEKVVLHRARKFGTTKFGAERFINGFLDLLSIFFISKFGKKPMHFFGTLGLFSFIIGTIITFWLIFEKIYQASFGVITRDITDQPLFFLAILAVIIGMQLFLAGFLGELVSRNSTNRNKYLIRSELGWEMKV